ncbi:MAG: alpha/beta fold hydrolase [Candidatus Woesearchaeota archaeon]
MKFVTSDEVRISYEYTKNTAATIVFLHGWLHNHTVWKPYIQELSKRHSVLTIDLRGHGKSSAPKNKQDYSMKRLAKDVHELLNHLHIHKPILVGHSLGSMIALQYALEYEAKQLVLIGATCRNPVGAHVKIPELAQKLLAYIHEEKELHYDKEIKVPYWLVGMEHTAPQAIIGCFYAIQAFDIHEHIHTITAPTTIIHGEHDHTTPLNESEYLHKHLPNNTLKEIPRAGHNLHATHPEELKNLLRILL